MTVFSDVIAAHPKNHDFGVRRGRRNCRAIGSSYLPAQIPPFVQHDASQEAEDLNLNGSYNNLKWEAQESSGETIWLQISLPCTSTVIREVRL
jgi:hypothetical protein